MALDGVGPLAVGNEQINTLNFHINYCVAHAKYILMLWYRVR